MQPAPVPQDVRRGGWYLQLTPIDRVTFLRSVAGMRPLARSLVDGISSRTTVRTMAVTSCGEGTSCAISAIQEDGTTRTATYQVEMFAGDFDRTIGSRFLTVHELGHLIEHEGLSEGGRQAFREAFARSRAWRACFKYDGGCVDPAEVFADQFAMYALRERSSYTAYGVPRLLTDAAFQQLLIQHYSPLT